MKYVPNFITTLNLASGFFAIIFASNGELLIASWFILAAMIFDFFDGFSARLLKAYSDIGKELDSLSDMVSFGVAPAIILFKLINNSVFNLPALDSIPSAAISAVIHNIPVLMPVFAALRLAKFNTDPGQATTFKGLPTPANALAVITLVIAANYSDQSLIKSFTSSPILLALFTVVLSILMVTSVPMLSLKVNSLKLKGNEGRYILIGMVLISFLFLGTAAAPLIIPFYIIASLISGII